MEGLERLRRVLVVSKRTRWEFASTRFGGLAGNRLGDLLASRGFPHERIMQAHESHHQATEKITRSLTRRGCDVRVVRAPALIASDVEGMDAVFACGGDGTVLETAARIKSSSVPVVAINTDPKLSTGYLCSFALQGKQSFEAGVLDKLKLGQFRPLYRTRIQVAFQRAGEMSPLLALNEIFFAERDASRPTVHRTTLPSLGEESFVQRSSGVIVCTGTGSTAWMRSASVIHRDDIIRTIRAYMDLKGIGQETLDDDLINMLSERVNEHMEFAPEERKLQYCMRELVLNGWHGNHDQPNTRFPKRGFESSMTIGSLAWDGVLTFDGIESQSVPYGEILNVSIAPLEQSLFTVKFN